MGSRSNHIPTATLWAMLITFALVISTPLTYQVLALCSWDSSIHDSVHLNRVTSPNERIYLIIKATVQLSHPASMEVVLRKRIAVNIYNKQVNTIR